MYRILYINIIILIVYIISGRLGLFLAVPPGYATAIWPPAGLALAGRLLSKKTQIWPGIVLGSFLTNLWISFSPASVSISIISAFCIGVGAALQAEFGRYLLTRKKLDQSYLETPREVIGFLFLAGVSCIVNATISHLVLISFRLIDYQEFFLSFLTWMSGDVMGVLIFFPLIMIFLGEKELWHHRRITVGLPLIMSFILTIIIYLRLSSQHQHYISLSIGLILNVQITGFLLILTGRSLKISKLVEIKTQELESARQSAELEAKEKSKFLALVSHEIRTPVQAIIGMTRLLLDEELDKKVRPMIKISYNNAKYLLNIINDILDISRIHSHKMVFEEKPFAPDRILNETLQSFEVEARRKNILLTCIVPNDIPGSLFGDEFRYAQILNNLLSNALKFTEQGEVAVELSASIKQEDRTDQDLTKVELVTRVRDTGIGIKAEDQERIFNEFSQADVSTTRIFGGTGLGLTISKNLCELMGGSISVESIPGKGTVFQFMIPLTRKQQEEIPVTQSDEIQPTESLGGNIAARYPLHILIVDDNVINQIVIQAMIQKTGYEPVIAENGRIALEMIAFHHFDVVFLDIEMPVMDGYTAAREIRKIKSPAETRIVAMTAHVIEDQIKNCMDAGMDDFLGKPIELEDLMVQIKTIVEWKYKLAG